MPTPHPSPAPADHPARSEIRPLTGLRIVAALWVVLFHFQFTPGDHYAWLWDRLDPIVDHGGLGVDLFYVLSGYVIAHTYLATMGPRFTTTRTVSFLWARFSRIWPAYAFVTTLFGIWLLLRLHTGGDGPIAFQTVQPIVDVQHWIKQLAMVQLWAQPRFDGSSWVGPLWSVSAEWFVYVLFPFTALVYVRMRRLPRPVLLVLAVAVMLPIAQAAARTGNIYFSYSWLVRVVAGFSAGVFMCLAVRQTTPTERVRRLASHAIPVLFVAILAGLWWGSRQGSGEYGAVVVALFPPLIGALALADRGLARLLASRPLVHGGRISYSYYLVHVAIFEPYWTAMTHVSFLAPDATLTPVVIPLVFAGTLFTAHLLWRFVEEPSRRWLRHHDPTGRRTAASAIAPAGASGAGAHGVGVGSDALAAVEALDRP